MTRKPALLGLAGTVAVAAATSAVVALTGGHSAPVVSQPTPIVVQHAAADQTPAPTADPTVAATPDPTAAATPAPIIVYVTPRPTAAPTADLWAGWTLGPDCGGCHRMWCDHSSSYVYAMTSPSEPAAICTATDNPATRFHASQP